MGTTVNVKYYSFGLKSQRISLTSGFIFIKNTTYGRIASSKNRDDTSDKGW